MSEGTFVKDDEQCAKKRLMPMEYLKFGFDDGSILVFGTKAGRGGGIIVVKTNDIEKLCQNDPLVQQAFRRIELQSLNSIIVRNTSKAEFN